MSFIASAFNLAAPQAAIVAKGVEIVAVLAIVGGAVGWFAHHERGIEVEKLHKSGTELEAKVEKANAATTGAYNAGVQSNQEKVDEAHHQVAEATAKRDAVAADFAKWVQQHPSGNPNAGVARTGGQSTAAGNGECGSRSCADLAIQLVHDGDNLARDLGLVTADLQGCQRDRDSLTGLPKL